MRRLIKNLALVADPFFDRVLEYRIRSIGFAAAAFLPYCILLVWERDAVTEVRHRIGRYLALYACLSGLLIGIALILGAWASFWLNRTPTLQFLLNQDAVGNLTFYNGLMLFLLGGLALLPGTLERTIDRVAVTLMLSGLLLSTVSTIVAMNVQPAGALTRILDVARFQSIILLVIGVVFYFSRFRAADIFAKWAFANPPGWKPGYRCGYGALRTGFFSRQFSCITSRRRDSVSGRCSEYCNPRLSARGIDDRCLRRTPDFWQARSAPSDPGFPGTTWISDFEGRCHLCRAFNRRSGAGDEAG